MHQHIFCKVYHPCEYKSSNGGISAMLQGAPVFQALHQNLSFYIVRGSYAHALDQNYQGFLSSLCRSIVRRKFPRSLHQSTKRRRQWIESSTSSLQPFEMRTTVITKHRAWSRPSRWRRSKNAESLDMSPGTTRSTSASNELRISLLKISGSGRNVDILTSVFSPVLAMRVPHFVLQEVLSSQPRSASHAIQSSEWCR